MKEERCSNIGLFSQLPDEVIVKHILPHLTLSDRLTRISLVNRRFSNLCRDKSLFKSLWLPKCDDLNGPGHFLIRRCSLLTKFSTNSVVLAATALENCPLLEELQVHPPRGSLLALAILIEIGQHGEALRKLSLVEVPLYFYSHPQRTKISRGLEQLTTLVLSYDCCMTDKDLMAIADTCPNLEYFDTYNAFPIGDDESWCYFLDATKNRINVLSFSGYLTNLSEDTYLHLGQCKLLQKLAIKCAWNLGAAGLGAILELPALTLLELDHFSHLLSDTAIADVFMCKRPDELFTLRISPCNALNDDSLVGIVSSCRGLETIGLKNISRITQLGLKTMFMENTQLECMKLEVVLSSDINWELLEGVATGISGLKRLVFKGYLMLSPQELQEKVQRLLDRIPSLEVVEWDKLRFVRGLHSMTEEKSSVHKHGFYSHLR